MHGAYFGSQLCNILRTLGERHVHRAIDCGSHKAQARQLRIILITCTKPRSVVKQLEREAPSFPYIRMVISAAMSHRGVVGRFASRPSSTSARSFILSCRASPLVKQELARRRVLGGKGNLAQHRCISRCILRARHHGSSFIVSATGSGSLFPGGSKQAKVRICSLYPPTGQHHQNAHSQSSA